MRSFFLLRRSAARRNVSTFRLQYLVSEHMLFTCYIYGAHSYFLLRSELYFCFSFAESKRKQNSFPTFFSDYLDEDRGEREKKKRWEPDSWLISPRLHSAFHIIFLWLFPVNWKDSLRSPDSSSAANCTRCLRLAIARETPNAESAKEPCSQFAII